MQYLPSIALEHRPGERDVLIVGVGPSGAGFARVEALARYEDDGAVGIACSP